MNPGQGEILVTVDPQAPTLAGSVRGASLPPTPFVGWLGLISALQQAVEVLGGVSGGDDAASSEGSAAEKSSAADPA